MKELSLAEVKKIELELMSSFDKLCKKRGWRYSLGGGSLLGAVRHKGFIPWDDDIDVIMPRPDYDKLIKYSRKHDLEFIVMTHETIDGYNNLHGKIVAKNTIIKDSSIDLSKYKLGVNIDIFPIEGLGDSYKEALSQFRKTSLKRELLNARTWKHFFRSKTHAFYYEPIRFVLFLISRLFKAKNLLKSIDRENRKKGFDEKKFVGCVSGCYRTKEILNKNIMDEYCDMQFEDRIFSGLVRYDDYLKSLYGDYMKLPPKEKQITHHTFKAYLMD